MGEIIIKVPRKKKELQLIKSEKLFNDIILQRQEKFKKKFEKVIKQEYNTDKEEDNIVESVLSTEVLSEDSGPSIREFKEEDLINAQKSIEVDSLQNVESNSIDFLQAELQAEVQTGIEVEVEIEEPPEAPPAKAIFTELYTISDDNDPVKVEHDTAEDKNTIDSAIVEKYIQEAYDKGYNDAKEVALFDAKEKVAEAHIHIKRIDKFMIALRAHYSEQLAEAKEKITDIALAVAETITEHEINKDNNYIVEHINRIFKDLEVGDVFSIKINPTDYDILLQAKANILSSQLSKVAFIKDNAIERGSCILNTSMGSLDTTISTQLKKIKEEIELMAREAFQSKEELIKAQVPEVEHIAGL